MMKWVVLGLFAFTSFMWADENTDQLNLMLTRHLDNYNKAVDEFDEDDAEELKSYFNSLMADVELFKYARESNSDELKFHILNSHIQRSILLLSMSGEVKEYNMPKYTLLLAELKSIGRIKVALFERQHPTR